MASDKEEALTSSFGEFSGLESGQPSEKKETLGHGEHPQPRDAPSEIAGTGLAGCSSGEASHSGPGFGDLAEGSLLTAENLQNLGRLDKSTLFQGICQGISPSDEAAEDQPVALQASEAAVSKAGPAAEVMCKVAFQGELLMLNLKCPEDAVVSGSLPDGLHVEDGWLRGRTWEIGRTCLEVLRPNGEHLLRLVLRIDRALETPGSSLVDTSHRTASADQGSRMRSGSSMPSFKVLLAVFLLGFSTGACVVRFRDWRQAEAVVQGQKLCGFTEIQEEVSPHNQRKPPVHRFRQQHRQIHTHKVFIPPRMVERAPGSPETEVLASMGPSEPERAESQDGAQELDKFKAKHAQLDASSNKLHSHHAGLQEQAR